MKRYLHNTRRSRFLNESTLNLNLDAVAHMPVAGDEYLEDVADTYLEILKEVQAAEEGEGLFILLEHTLPYAGVRESTEQNKIIASLRALQQNYGTYSVLESALRLQVRLPIEHYLKDIAYGAIQYFNEEFSSKFNDDELIEYLIEEDAWLNRSHIPKLIGI